MILSKSKTLFDVVRVTGNLLLLFASGVVRAQVGPAMIPAPSLHIFGAYTSSFSEGTNKASFGYSIGGFGQTSHLWGIETRGSVLRGGTNERRYDALVGPRVALHRSKLSPYAAALAGIARVDTWQPKGGNYLLDTYGNGGEWKILGGVDYYARDRWTIRLGEISYGEIYLSKHGLTTIDYTAGIAYRLPKRRH